MTRRSLAKRNNSTQSDEKVETYSKKTDEKMDTIDETMENYSKKTDDKIDKFVRQSTIQSEPSSME